MKNFLDIEDIPNISRMIDLTMQLKSRPFEYATLGKEKTLGLLFFNSSLRTRLSTQKAAEQLGMKTMTVNFTTDAWNLEFEDGTIMDGANAEHIREAAAVISQYCDMIAVRAFPTLKEKAKDLSEQVLNGFKKYASVPVVNMESATAHPLQALTDAVTIHETTQVQYPKVVLSWAPHPKALPHAVAQSFIKIMQRLPVNLVITHPEGYELNPDLTGAIPINYNQEEAFQGADIIYAKNWSSFTSYGQVLQTDPSWMITKEKMKLTNTAKFMHCLPVRRNVIVEDAVLNGSDSVVIQQAANRTFAAQAVLKTLLENG